ncbi:unnamed protein product [Cladocopium goreaui]|uniref:Uncharacterized protein n=1 Tax=Cladocopium goreaui TaxID=2562237 RepID=A0A9P1C2E1_9DINO|nr:unnamed protein product [Cladocopium goreaui]
MKVLQVVARRPFWRKIVQADATWLTEPRALLQNHVAPLVLAVREFCQRCPPFCWGKELKVCLVEGNSESEVLGALSAARSTRNARGFNLPCRRIAIMRDSVTLEYVFQENLVTDIRTLVTSVSLRAY